MSMSDEQTTQDKILSAFRFGDKRERVKGYVEELRELREMAARACVPLSYNWRKLAVALAEKVMKMDAGGPDWVVGECQEEASLVLDIDKEEKECEEDGAEYIGDIRDVNCSASISDGIMTLEDGTQIDLQGTANKERKDKPQYIGDIKELDQ
jgi:hypothetical protein